MVLIIPALILIATALVLLHVRKQSLLAEYARLAERGLERGNTGVESALRPLREIMLTESLRKGILSLVLGTAMIVIFVFARTAIDPFPDNLFLTAGIIIAAHGIGHLTVWFIVDRPRIPRK